MKEYFNYTFKEGGKWNWKAIAPFIFFLGLIIGGLWDYYEGGVYAFIMGLCFAIFQLLFSFIYYKGWLK